MPAVKGVVTRLEQNRRRVFHVAGRIHGDLRHLRRDGDQRVSSFVDHFLDHEIDRRKVEAGIAIEKIDIFAI